MMAVDFSDVEEFPVDLPFTIERRPMGNTARSQMEHGDTKRQQRWARPFYRYTIDWNILDNDDRDIIERFFLAHLFDEDGIDFFLFEDPKFHSQSGVVFGQGDGTENQFRLDIDYGFGKRSAKFPAKWIQSGTETIFKDGSEVDPALYAFDYKNAVITFNDDPASGVELSASYDYFRKCIFDEDQFVQEARTEQFQRSSLRIREVS